MKEKDSLDLNAEHHLEFEEYLKKQELKYTRQRKDIVDFIFKIHGHFEVESLLDQLHRKEVKVSRGTVYSSIKLLVGSGLIRKIRTPQNQVFYEHVFGHDHHDHLICTNCQKVIEFSDDIIETRQIEVAAEYGFKVLSHAHNLYGLCSDCI